MPIRFALAGVVLFLAIPQASAQFACRASIAGGNIHKQNSPVTVYGRVLFNGMPFNGASMDTVWVFPFATTPIAGALVGPLSPGTYVAVHPFIGAGMNDPTTITVNVTFRAGLTVIGTQQLKFQRVP